MHSNYDASDEFVRSFHVYTGMPQNEFHPLVWILGDPKFGRNVYVGGFSEINATGASITIGNNCDIGSFTSINCSDSHKKAIGLGESIERSDIILEDNVFIGSHCVIKGGAIIGHHSVVAAGTVVDAGEVRPYSLVHGNPMVVRQGYYRSLE